MAGDRGLLVNNSPGLVDILDRILDKGLVVAGDIKISLANVELLTIQIRLLVCSIDKAEQIGLNWWRYDRSLVHEHHDQRLISRTSATSFATRRRISCPQGPSRPAGISPQKHHYQPIVAVKLPKVGAPRHRKDVAACQSNEHLVEPV